MPAQPGAHGRQQRIPRGTGKIFHPQLQGVGAPASRTAGDDGLAVRHAPGNQRRLGRHGIDGVDDKIGVGRDQLLFLARLDELIDRMHGGVGRDVVDALRHHLDLGGAQRAGERMDLTVDVGLGHVVQVDEGEATHTAARQRLGRPGADTANADNDDMGLPEPLAAGVSVDAGDGGKATIGHGGVLSVWMDGIKSRHHPRVAARLRISTPRMTTAVPTICRPPVGSPRTTAPRKMVQTGPIMPTCAALPAPR